MRSARARTKPQQMRDCRRLLASLVVLAAASLSIAAAGAGDLTTVRVTGPLDESGQWRGDAFLRPLGSALAAGLRAAGLKVVTGVFTRADMEIRPRLIQCPEPAQPAPLEFLRG